MKEFSMPPFFLGVDFRFASLAFGYVAALGGLFMRLVMNGHSDIGVIFPVALGLAAAGVLFAYRAAVAHFLFMSWLLIQHPSDDGALGWIQVLMPMRRKLAVAAGGLVALCNAAVMMQINGGGIFSYESVAVILVITILAHFGWFYKQTPAGD
jgi:hypothetical protein